MAGNSIVNAADRLAGNETLLIKFLTTGVCFGMGQGIPNRFGICQESALVADLRFARRQRAAYKREGQLPLALAGFSFTY